MNDMPIWFGLIVFAVVFVGGYFAVRNKTCSAIFFRLIGGLCLIAVGMVFLLPGLKMMGAFAETEKKAGAQVVFTDTPIFLGSPEAWIIVGLGMILGGGYLFYSFFKRLRTK